MTSSICPCDNDSPSGPDNPPGLARIGFRHGDWLSIRRALLAAREGEAALADWRPGGTQDFALMIAEWWATLGEVLEFYNEEIANEAFVGTAVQPQSVTRLISLLGYRPRPGLAATASLGAIVTGRDPLTLPKGFQVESLPAAGKQPQMFEVSADTDLVPGGSIDVSPPASLVSPETGSLYVGGKVNVAAGDVLRLSASSGDWLLTVTSAAPTASGAARTRIAWTADAIVPTTLKAADCRLLRAAQMLPVWTLNGDPINWTTLHLAAISRSVGGGDKVLASQAGMSPLLVGVYYAVDVVWYANPDGNDPSVKPAASPIPVPHTQLTLDRVLDSWTPSAMRIGVDWIEVGKLVDQDPAPWSGTPSTLDAVAPQVFDDAVALPTQVADADGRGVPAALSALIGATSATVSVDEAYAESLPISSPLTLLTQLVGVTRGKTVAHEILGSGDARVPDQNFTLAKSPVTYLRSGAAYTSTVTVLVNGEPWQEVESFYEQAASAAIFTLSENEQGKTIIQFGDGINGRRLPSGVDNVVATYRYGSGADSPGPGKLTRIVNALTGLSKLRNPVAAGGGGDPEPADEIRLYAPRSVLTFGRAVSPLDYEAIAAQAAAPDRVHAVWAWDDVQQRAAITVYVAGGPDKLATVRDVLAVSGDPHRPVAVEAATPVEIGLALTLLVAPGYETDPIEAAAIDALTGDDGLFSADRMGIGQYLFNSSLSAALLPIPGVVTLLETRLVRNPGGNETELHGQLHRLDEGEWFDLSADALSIAIEVADG